MVRKHPIRCPHCHKMTGFHQEDFMFMVIANDINCPICGNVVIKGSQIEYGHEFFNEQRGAGFDKANAGIYTPPQSVNINSNLDLDD